MSLLRNISDDEEYTNYHTINQSSTAQLLNKEQLIVNSFFVTFGALGAVAHFLLIFTVAINKKLHRKELFILLGVCMGELLYSIGHIVGGTKRLYWYLNRMENIKVSAWDCQTEVFTFFYIIGPQLTALMNLYISVDRFVAISFYQVYIRITVRHIIKMMTVIFCFTICSYLVGLGIAYSMPRLANVPRQCLATWASSSEYAIYYTSLTALLESISVAVYIAVVVAIKRHASHLHAEIRTRAEERQMKVTRTVTLTVVLSFFFYIIPWVLQALVTGLKFDLASASLLAPIMWISIQANNVLMSIIYWSKLDDVRNSFISKFKRSTNKVSELGANMNTV